MNHVRFRPRVEECEPRLVPSGGDWHVLVQAGKALAHAGRQEPATLAGLQDPFCEGLDPGPCANPDVTTLRTNLNDFANALWITWVDWGTEVQNASNELARLQQQNAPFAEVWPARLHLDYVQSRQTQTELDAQDASGVAATPDTQLEQAAKAMSQRWLRQAGNDVQVEKNNERNRVQALKAQDFANMQRWERLVTIAQGAFDQQIVDFQNYGYFVKRNQ